MLRFVKQIALLLSYSFARSLDVHSGYFRSELLRTLIFRLICLGWDDTVRSYVGFESLDAACVEHQIKVVLSISCDPN